MDEKELVRRAKANDNEALSAIFEKYNSLINRIARRYYLVGGESEDLVQEGYIGLFNAILSFNESEDVTFKTFASGCIDRKIKSAITQANRQKNKPLNGYMTIIDDNDDENEEGYIVISNELTPEERVIDKQKISMIKTEINRVLTMEQKKILSMYLNGDSYSDIATQMNTNVKKVYNTIFQIKKKLQFIKDIGED